MICAAGTSSSALASDIAAAAAVFVGTTAAVRVGARPMLAAIRRREKMYATVLGSQLLLDITPRSATILTGAAMVLLAAVFHVMLGGVLSAILGLFVGAFAPHALLRLLHRRRLRRLEAQLVSGIQTLASGVRAGLNLVQAMELIARNGAVPLRQEFAHLLREYEFGVPLEDAMHNAAERIGSPDFRLLFAALRTHRQRGGDLGETLDRIAESIREIQRLENRVRTLTAQGRATARWLGAMPAAVLVLYYSLVDSSAVRMLFVEDLGKLVLVAIVVLNIAGFLWVRKIVAVDI